LAAQNSPISATVASAIRPSRSASALPSTASNAGSFAHQSSSWPWLRPEAP